MRLRPLILACLLAALAPAAAHAQSGAVQKAALKVFQDYVADGRIDPCRHTSEELKLAYDNVPPDIEQYAADYPAAIKAALQARARGECAGKKPAEGLIQPPAATATPAPTPRATATPEPTPVPTAVPTRTVVPEPPEPERAPAAATATAAATQPDVALERVATARPASTAPMPVLLLGLLALLFALGTLLALGARRFELAERFPGAAHAWRDVRWRSGGTWDEFRDWLRLGR